MHTGKLRFLTACILFFLSLAQVYAMGQGENGLSIADSLIAEKNYNQALLVLKDFIKNNPERFDEAQARIQKIIATRESYNKTADNLLDTLVNEPTNNEKKLDEIKKLSDLEPNPSEETKKFIVKTKEAALFTYNRAQYDTIMSKAKVLLDTGKYLEAIRLYESGFVLYKPEFDVELYDAAYKANVNEDLKTITDSLNKFDAVRLLVSSRSENLIRSLKGLDADTVQKDFEAFSSALQSLSEERNAVARKGRDFEKQFALLKLNTENHFLPFAQRFTLGRKTVQGSEGILGAYDLLWNDIYSKTANAFYERVSNNYTNIESLFAQINKEKEDAEKIEIIKILNSANQFASLRNAIIQEDSVPTILDRAKEFIKLLANESNEYGFMLEAVNFYSTISGIRLKALEYFTFIEKYYLDTIKKIENIVTIKKTLVDNRVLIQKERVNLEQTEKAISLIASENSAKAAQGLAYPTTIKNQEELLFAVKAEIEKLKVNEIAVMTYAIELEYKNALSLQNLGNEDFIKASTLLNGTDGSAIGLSGIIVKYPTEAELSFKTQLSALNKLQTLITGILQYYGNEKDFAMEGKNLKEWLTKTQELNIEVSTKIGEITQLAKTAESNRLQAESLRQEAEKRIQDAKTQLRAENFDGAKSQIARARERYNQSLNIQENAKLRSDSDKLLSDLSKEIIDAEIKRVTITVQNLIKSGKNFYYQGVFDKAEDAFIQAQTKWKVVFPQDDDPEVKYWLELVRQAISIKTGRDIPENAPLYPEMSQLLSQARNLVNQGKALIAKNKRTEGLSLLTEARKKIREVKVIFPLNQEASVLELQIDQIIDPIVFEESFAAKVRQAIAKQDAGNKREAYSDLSDLRSIKPNYAGLASRILKLEYELGLKQQPPDPAKLARSSALTDAAAKIIDRNDRVSFPIALTQLNEALILNPQNERASNLKVRIQTDLGGKAVVVMSGADEELYQRAVSLFQNGDKLLANSLVLQLWAKPQNQKVQKVIDLKKRIEASL